MVEGAQERPRVVLVVNPKALARHGDAPGILATRLRAAEASVEIVEAPDEATASRQLATLLADGPVATVVACGGDGTVHGVLQHLVGTAVPLAILPLGTGNDGARAVGAPMEPVAAAELVVLALRRPDLATRVVDVGEVSTADGCTRVFLAVLSSGFDSRVNERANAMRRPRGMARYVVAVVAELGVFRPVAYRLEVDGAVQDMRAMLMAVGNGPAYGGGMRVCPTADVADGLLDVTVLAEVSTPRFLRLFPTVFRGTHVRQPEVTTYRGTTVEIDAVGQLAYADGERIGPLPLVARVRPRALTVVAPPAT